MEKLSDSKGKEGKQMSELAKTIGEIQERVARAAEASGRRPEEVRLMAVTKTVEVERINQAIDCGIRLIGENKVQELLSKYDQLKKDGLEIHLIGHLQTNKVKYIIDKVSMIQSADSLRLLEEIDRQAGKHGRIMQVLVEVNIGHEESKTGVLPEEAETLIREGAKLKNLHIRGLMAIPPVDEPENAALYFEKMRKLFIDIGEKKIDNVTMEILSMGMSGDFEEAIAGGSNLVRVGTALFGRRTYPTN